MLWWRLRTTGLALALLAGAPVGRADAASSAQRCAAAKVKAVAAAGSAQLECFQDATAKARPVDSACLAAARAQLAADFGQVERKGGCQTIDDAARTSTRVIEPFGVVVAEKLPSTGVPACSCGATRPAKLQLTGAPISGNCGVVRDAGGATLLDLACGFTYFGGGGGGSFVNETGFTSLLKVAACADKKLALAGATAGEVGGPNPDRHCTTTGCLFQNGPLPAVNLCLVIKVNEEAAGTADCSTGTANIALPLRGDIFVAGDLLPARPGIQPCPICDATTLTCQGGLNDGLACSPFGAPGEAFPVSHDCPSDPAVGNFGITFTFDLVVTTGTSTRSAGPAGTQQRVFCGFCRDVSGTASGCFEGDPSGACPVSATPGVPRRCRSNADCAEPFESCEQRTEGAFGSQTAQSIVETGSPGGPLTTGGGPGLGTLASTFCISPAFTIADPGNLPGPGAISLPTFLELLP